MKKGRIFALVFTLLVLLIAVSSPGIGEKSGKVSSQAIDDIQQTGKAKVIVILKDKSELPEKFQGVSSQSLREESVSLVGEEKVGHRFTSFNGFSASITQEELEKLEADERVERIDYDMPVHAFLQDSVPLINASKAWPIQINGMNITGEGETICILDTGVNYTHPALGGCTIKNLSLTGNNESYVLESAHPYSNSYDNIWKVNYTGFSNISVHFVNISTEAHYDFVTIYNSQNESVATFSGILTDLWSPSVSGDTLYVELKTDSSTTDYGFYIDQVINGTTNLTYDWSNCSKVINGWDVVNNDPDPMDDSTGVATSHGTHVTGIAAAAGGINGVATGANIISIKALDSSGSGYGSEVVRGIEWCTNNALFYNISVISMSLGADCDLYPNLCYSNYCDAYSSQTEYSDAINAAVAKNISVIIASGNDGNITAISSPACIQNATAVGWSNKDDTVASNSNRNSITDLIAPGTNINSTWIDGNYGTISGTSMATPHVAGAFAIVREFYRLKTGRVLKPAEIQDVLNDTGKRISDTSGLGLNFSRINVYNAILSFSDGPNVTLDSPDENYTDTTASAANVTFNCSASDIFGLTNISLWITNNNNASFLLNQTNTVSGTTNSTTFVLGLAPGTYTWNCQAGNAGGQANFSSLNRSIIISQAKQVIFIGIDGMQYNHYVRMLLAGELGNFSRLISNGGWNGTANITGHNQTKTAPGNAEMHTGLNETLTNITDNTAGKSIPAGNTTFERLKIFDSSIALGSIYGKQTDYVPDGILGNAKSSIDWWQNKTTYPNSDWPDGTNYVYSENVSDKAIEFIDNYSDDSFYLFVYFGVLDGSGHAYGENSSEYDQAFINADKGLGILIDELSSLGLRGSRNVTQIIITADHGWNTNSTGHNVTNSDTTVLPLITNNISLVFNSTSGRKQCDLAPTILDYFGMPSSQYQDILDNSCNSMIAPLNLDLTAPVITINKPANQTWYNASIFNVTTNESSYCWAVLDDNTNITLTNITSNGTAFYYINTSTSTTSTNTGHNVTFYCNDTSGNLGSSVIRYFGVDTAKPKISLAAPVDDYTTNTSSSTKSITFIFNATDNSNEIALCELIVDGSVSSSTTSINLGTNTSISKSLSSDNSYNWRIDCTDEAGNKNSSATRSLTIDLTSSGSGSTGSDGSSGAADTGTTEQGMTYLLTDSQIKNGTQKLLYENDVVKFSIENRSHILTVFYVRTTYVRVRIESDVITTNINISEEKKFDLNKDNYYDFYLKLNALKGLEANLTFKQIYEKIENATTTGTLTEMNATTAQKPSALSRAYNWVKQKLGSISWKVYVFGGLTLIVVLGGGFALYKFIKNYLRMRRYYLKGY